jgi:REP element-mobilizing transposase RayT
MAGRLDYQLAYRRNLPHIQPSGATLFITFRLTDSIPVEVLARLAEEWERRFAREREVGEEATLAARLYDEEKCHFGRLDAILDAAAYGPTWLRDPAIRDLVHEAFANGDGRFYEVIAYTIMPNHVHVVLTPNVDEAGVAVALSRIMHGVKGYSARRGNDVLSRRGQFWQHESYDHYVRNEADLWRIIRYVLHNPAKAGLVEEWQLWPGTYLRADD